MSSTTEYHRQWQAKNRERVNANAKRYRQAHLEACKARERRWRDANKEIRASAARKRRANNPEHEKHLAERNRFHSPLYKAKYHARKGGYAACAATPAELKAAFTGYCFICHAPEGGSRRLHVDHCHTTGTFRGWLCKGCNHALGMVNDSPERLRSLAAYLKQFTKECV